MVYTYKIGISEVEHDGFLKQSPQVNLLQSSQWAKVKNEWYNERLGFFKDGELVAVASVLLRKLIVPASFTFMYIPWGPVMDYQDQELVAFVLASLKKYGRTQWSIFIKFDPFLQLSKQSIHQEACEETAVLAVKNHLESLGCRWSGRAKTLSDTVQPTFHAVLHSEEFAEEKLTKRVRQQLRTCRNKGVVVGFGREELIDDFSALLKKTETRKSIHLRGKEYYQKILAAFPEDSYITLATVHLAERQDHFLKEKQKLLKESARFTEVTQQSKKYKNQKELERVNVELDFLDRELKKGREVIPLAGTLTVDFGGTSENIYAGMDDAYKHYQPALLVWFENAKYAFDRGATWQNLGGVEPTMDGGLYQFKSKLNPVIEEYIGEFDLIVSPILYKIFQVLLEIRKKLRKKK
ncbi:MurM%2C putative [Streptococcus suis]|uniref:MurM, putative n=1 Tax=Streptococcus suis TaxID=1307 RepID=A0A0Z8FCG6_STRSU|nr:peptidoglycan bridge formation glycyltransferase FemA/FemB family protein [Streptococcus suis]NQH39411.1 aminoacyltransferase [Streptococcus suis]CYU77740.1 MurM%2C putative [Streptococcus suis]